MNMQNIITELNIKYYKNIIRTLAKSDISYDWLDDHLEKLEKTYNDKDVEESTETKQKTSTESETHSMIFSDEEFYKKPWAKLNPIHKVLKLKEFINNLKNISDKEKNELKEKVVELVKTKILTKKEKVDYDSVNGRILSLTNLEYKDGKYFIHKE
jgi:hypothetical protein